MKIQNLKNLPFCNEDIRNVQPCFGVTFRDAPDGDDSTRQTDIGNKRSVVTLFWRCDILRHFKYDLTREWKLDKNSYFYIWNSIIHMSINVWNVKQTIWANFEHFKI